MRADWKETAMINWMRSYVLMLRWQALSQRTILPLSLVVQIMVAVGFVIGDFTIRR